MRIVLRERGIRRLIAGLQDLRRNIGFEDAYEDAADAVSRDAKRYAPVLSGRLRRSIRVTSGPNRGRITAGNQAMPPYAPIQERGGYNNIEGKFFMRRALETNRRRAITLIERGVERQIRRSL